MNVSMLIAHTVVYPMANIAKEAVCFLEGNDPGNPRVESRSPNLKTPGQNGGQGLRT